MGETCFDVGLVDAADDGDMGVKRGGSNDDGILWRRRVAGLLRRAAGAVRDRREDGALALSNVSGASPGAIGVGGYGC